MYRRRPGGLVIGMAAGAAIARPRNTVVVAGPVYPAYGYPTSTVVVAGPPPPTQVFVTGPPPPTTVYQQPAYNPPPPQPQPNYNYPPQPAYQPPPPQYPPTQYPPAPAYQEKPYQGYQPQPGGYPPQQGGYPMSNAPPVEIVKVPEVRPPQPKIERRYFLIVNEANCMVMELQGGNARPGAHIVIGKRRPDKFSPQSFYLDEEGVIRARLNEYAFESKSGGDHVVLMPYNGDARQQWVFMENRVVNKLMTNDCIGLKKRLFLHDDADVIVSRYENKPYQHWRMDYI